MNNIEVLERLSNDDRETSDEGLQRGLAQVYAWRAQRLVKVCQYIGGLDVGDVAERAAIREYDAGEDSHSAEVKAIMDILTAQSRLTASRKKALESPDFWKAIDKRKSDE